MDGDSGSTTEIDDMTCAI